MHFSESKTIHQMTTSIMNAGVIVHNKTPERKSPSWLRRFWADLIHSIMRDHEPCIWERRNSAGEIYYHCYDPHTGRSVNCGSETEVRIWFEQLRF
jgi:hypothetical protein